MNELLINFLFAISILHVWKLFFALKNFIIQAKNPF